jgi:hypothetical protein
MGREIGTNKETHIMIIVETTNPNAIVTAFPWRAPSE